MRYLLILAAFLLLSGCGSDDVNNEVVVVGNDGRSGSEQNETDETEIESIDEESGNDNVQDETEVEDETSQVNTGEKERPDGSTGSEDDDSLISNLEPNKIAQMVNEENFEIASEENRDYYERITDIDGDGNDETVQILNNTRVDEDEVQIGHYILAIFDSNSNAVYAEYTYNFYDGTAPRIMDVIDMDGDGISEIVMENLMSSTATAATGLQSPSRFIYKYDESIKQFNTVSTLGRFLQNEATDTYEINVNDVITGLDYNFSYAPAVELEESEGHLRDLIDFGIMSEETGGFADGFVENTHGNHRYQHPSYLMQLDGMSDIGVVYNDPVFSARWLTLNATSLYEYNSDYNWMEMVGIDGEFETEAGVNKERELFTISDFSSRFDTYSVSKDDYMGEWTMVIDGSIQEFNYMTSNISDEQIIETHVESGDVAGHNSEVVVDTMELANDTNQLTVSGEVTFNDATEVNNSYHNTFTIIYIEDTKHMMDKYGHLYLQLD